MATANLTIPLPTEGATNNDSDVIDALNLLDGVTQIRIEDNDLTAPPGSPVAGKVYIPAATATGDWASQEGNLAVYSTANGWTFVTPTGGMTAFIHDEKELICYSSQESAWFPVQDRWSTTEHWTGKYGKGGGKIYAKCFEGISVPNAGTTSTAHGITSVTLTAPIVIEATMNDGATAYQLDIPVSGGIRAYAKVTSSNLDIVTSADLSTFTANVRLEYQKA